MLLILCDHLFDSAQCRFIYFEFSFFFFDLYIIIIIIFFLFKIDHNNWQNQEKGSHTFFHLLGYRLGCRRVIYTIGFSLQKTVCDQHDMKIPTYGHDSRYINFMQNAPICLSIFMQISRLVVRKGLCPPCPRYFLPLSYFCISFVLV